MGDKIERVSPVVEIPTRLPTHVQRLTTETNGDRTPRNPDAAPAGEGYDLHKITPEEARVLLETELMNDEKAVATDAIAALKTALQRRADNNSPEQGDIAILITASSRVDTLDAPQYSKMPSGDIVPAASPELRKNITAFNVLASQYGNERQPMRG